MRLLRLRRSLFVSSLYTALPLIFNGFLRYYYLLCGYLRYLFYEHVLIVSLKTKARSNKKKHLGNSACNADKIDRLSI